MVDTGPLFIFVLGQECLQGGEEMCSKLGDISALISLLDYLCQGRPERCFYWINMIFLCDCHSLRCRKGMNVIKSLSVADAPQCVQKK